MSEVMIAVQHVFKTVTDSTGTLTILRDIDFTLSRGETAAIVGASGSGKSTLLSIIAGLDTPSSGTVHMAGTDLFALSEDQRAAFRAAHLGFVFQSFQLLANLTALENVMLPLELAGRRDARAAAGRMLERVGLGQRLASYPKVLSGGEQQRVALARALAPQPKVLLLDEPLSALDLKLRKEMQVELKRLQTETGITFIFVTHDQEEALTMSDRIGVMSAGKLQQVGSPKDIYTRPVNRFVASFIGETNFLPGTVVPGGVKLAGGAVVEVATEAKGAVTVTVRPEQVRIVAAQEAGAIAATVRLLVYFGTDTHCHLELADGTEVVARVQSPASGEAGIVEGSAVGIRFAPGAAQVLED